MEILRLKVKDEEGNEYLFFPEFNLILPEEVEKEENVFYKKVVDFLMKIRVRENKRTVSQKEIKRKIANVRKLLLEVSEACNLRCRYCVYSGRFLDRRKHSDRLMSWGTAKKSIDFFFNWLLKNEKYRYYPYILSIGFYGGEPLLNLEVIKDSVLYSKALLKKGELNFSVTTNGLLLDDERIDFFIKNDFWISISLDGPPEIHDRNKGEGGFEKIIEKIERIYKKYPEYYKKKVSYSIVYAKDTDLKKVKDFFSQEIFENSFGLNFGYVVDEYSSLKFPESGLNGELVIEEIKDKKRKGVGLTKIEEEIIKIYFRMRLKDFILRAEGDYGSNCILGAKTLFVNVDGEFYGCEKTGRSFRIGELSKGFDFEAIRKIERDWREKTSKKCKECPVQGFCSACIASTGFNRRIILKKFCYDLIKNFNEKVKEYVEFQKI